MKGSKDVKDIDLKTIRRAVADLWMQRGCGCCLGYDLKAAEEKVAKLLKIQMYSDKSGYNFSKYRSKGNE